MAPSLSASLLDLFSDCLAAQTGLYFPPERWPDLERGLQEIARELGFNDPAACVTALIATPLTQPQIEILAGQLAVGETYFFREPASFQLLEHKILPELLAARGTGLRFLRLWSAACCTGEEAYSLAILLDRLIPDIAKWNITILATDINPAFLRRARQGVYSEWSFRGVDLALKERYFTPVDGNRFKIHAHIRNRVTFLYHNLAEAGYPSVASNTNAMDIILCRNVLMYFHQQCAAQVIGRLHNSLVNGGWLIPSPVDGTPSMFAPLVCTHTDGALFYRKLDPLMTAALPVRHEAVDTPYSEPPPIEIPPPPVVVPAINHAQAMEWFRAGRYGEAAKKFEAHLLHTPLDTQTMSLLARAYANQGQLAEAMHWCRRAIDADRLTAANHYLLAMIHQEEGDLILASSALKRALFLDPHFVLAHYALATVSAHPRDARKHYQNAASLLAGRPSAEILLSPEGITVGQILASIRYALEDEAHV